MKFPTFPISRRRFLQASSTFCALLATRAKAAQATLLRSPYLQNVTPISATVMWTMSANVSASMTLRDATGNTRTVPASVRQFSPAQTGLAYTYFQYQAVVNNLQPGTTYSYQILNGGQIVVAPVSRMQISTPATDGPFDFLHFGDSGMNNNTQKVVAAQMAAENPALILANGDLAYTYGAFSDIENNFFPIYRDQMARTPFFTSLGNHEYLTGSGAPSLAGRSFPAAGVADSDYGRYYSFDWNNVHFVALDSNDPLVSAINGNGDMLNWLDRDLAATDKFWRIVYFHHPPYATGEHQYEAPAGQVRDNIVPILEKHGVQAVFSGHEHSYQRTFPLTDGQVSTDNSGIVYFTSGGGGADLYYPNSSPLIAQLMAAYNYLRCSINGVSLAVQAIGLDGQTVDSSTLKPLPMINGQALNSASFDPLLASGGAVSLFGFNFSPRVFISDFANAVTAVGGVSVTLNDTPVPILYAGANQINLQIPYEFTGSGILQVITSNGSDTTQVTIAPVAPAIFENPSVAGTALALHADQTIVSPDAPAAAGEWIDIVVTGLGAVTADLQTGIAPGSRIPVIAPVAVSLNGGNVPATAVTCPGTPGTYFVHLQVPAALQGTTLIQVVSGSSTSGTLRLVVA